MNTVLPLCLGFLLDQLLGDPPGWPHPVRWIGWVIQRLESPLRALLPARLAGVVLLSLVAGGTGGMTWLLLMLAATWHPWPRIVMVAMLVAFGLATRSLAQETRAVLAPCEQGDLETARTLLGRIVGRDTATLSVDEIYRACIETVAENTTDAVVAPLCWFALGGPVGLWVFKAISTLDSMVGYRNERYRRFGWASARADDVVNYVPARITLVLLAVAALVTGNGCGSSWRIGWRDGRKHPSPNSGVAEAAMAGALGVQLGGAVSYSGFPSCKPVLGESQRPLTASVVREAIVLMEVTAWLMLGAAVGVTLVRIGAIR